MPLETHPVGVPEAPFAGAIVLPGFPIFGVLVAWDPFRGRVLPRADLLGEVDTPSFYLQFSEVFCFGNSPWRKEPLEGCENRKSMQILRTASVALGKNAEEMGFPKGGSKGPFSSGPCLSCRTRSGADRNRSRGSSRCQDGRPGQRSANGGGGLSYPQRSGPDKQVPPDA